MSKFNAALTYNKKDLYNIFYEIELNKSMRVQFTDLRLRDFTDVTGELKFWYFMPQERLVKPPHLYKVYNGEKSFLVLGTNHGLPLSVYSQKIIDTIFDSKVLIVENLGYDEVTNDSMSASEDNESEVDNKDCRVLEDHSQDDIFKETWFERMPVLCQQYLEAFFDKIVAPIPESRNLVLKVSNFDEESIYDILTSLPSEKGMDVTIKKKFEAGGKKLGQLETANEREIEYEELRENPFEVLKEFLEFCKGSGIFALEPLIEASKNYLT